MDRLTGTRVLVPFLGECKGVESDVHGDGTNGVVFFKARKKAKRHRKSGTRNLPDAALDSPASGFGSVDKGRPTKRNRAQLEEDSDPFSINRILAQLNHKNDLVSSPSGVPGVNLNIPLNSSGVPIGEFSKAASRSSSSIPTEPQGVVGGSGPVDDGG
ncbi:hypothetical protein Hanom_Chr08g00683251 [Helianthus anomalus]